MEESTKRKGRQSETEEAFFYSLPSLVEVGEVRVEEVIRVVEVDSVALIVVVEREVEEAVSQEVAVETIVAIILTHSMGIVTNAMSMGTVLGNALTKKM
jgi:hypothetical protein